MSNFKILANDNFLLFLKFEFEAIMFVSFDIIDIKTQFN